MGKKVLLESLGIGFEDFEEGFYNYSGELVYIIKEKDRLRMKSPNKWGLSGKLIYEVLEGTRKDFDFEDLEPVDPYDFLKQKTSSLFDFIKEHTNRK